ncbi:class I lanthipeptide [Chitinophaga sp. Cy-1792]|uniref:class I lanthipeptide n=1 Tax=Chitinophaga sp. Cy-1792 TaxID=2608339 RepID=UPI00141F75C0|nr:class I lanthipeptide [Chitinophaga sp. Cy-1792]NIG54999.1 hypothetical protein [Chitinophaga sp. Cy-1792]
MRKRKLSLEKKLSLNKETVTTLTASNQQQLAGGKALTLLPNCAYTAAETCVTIPPGQMYCIAC